MEFLLTVIAIALVVVVHLRFIIVFFMTLIGMAMGGFFSGIGVGAVTYLVLRALTPVLKEYGAWKASTLINNPAKPPNKEN